MKVIDPGHEYELDSLDGEQPNRLVFVKREGPGYPGNVGHHPGTTMQETLRALIHRAEYVNNQTPCPETLYAIHMMKHAVFSFEVRAAERHGRKISFTIEEAAAGVNKCKLCGHVGCPGDCRSGG